MSIISILIPMKADAVIVKKMMLVLILDVAWDIVRKGEFITLSLNQ